MLTQKGSMVFKGKTSTQPKEVVEFHLGNYGLSSKKLFELFQYAKQQHSKDENKFITAQSQNTELLPIDEQYIQNSAIKNFSYRQTLKHVLKEKGAKNFEDYNQPIAVLQQQKDWIIRLRNIVGGEMTDLLDASFEDTKKDIQEKNELRNNLDILIDIFNEYIRDTQSQLVKTLK